MTDDDEIDSELDSQARHGVSVTRVDAMIRAEFGGSGIAWCGVQLDHCRVPTERQSERMLAST